MSTSPEREIPTRLNASQYARCWGIVEAFLRKHKSIRNRQIRDAANIGYDQAIHFFNRAIDEKRLVRHGTSGGTHYVLRK